MAKIHKIINKFESYESGTLSRAKIGWSTIFCKNLGAGVPWGPLKQLKMMKKRQKRQKCEKYLNVFCPMDQILFLKAKIGQCTIFSKNLGARGAIVAC